MSRKPVTRYDSRVVAYAVSRAGEPLLADLTTRVEIEDEGVGEFISIIQSDVEETRLKIDPDEWPLIRAAVDALVATCR
jgi:hypothetical protein